VIAKLGLVAAAVGLVLYIDKTRTQPTFALLGKADALGLAAAGVAVWFVAR
jgi:hypothetical protein